MTFGDRLRRPGWRAGLLLLALSLFSVGYSILAENDLWPRLPAGALHGTDLAAGFACVTALAAILAFQRRAPKPDEGAPIFHPADSRMDGDAPRLEPLAPSLREAARIEKALS